MKPVHVYVTTTNAVAVAKHAGGGRRVVPNDRLEEIADPAGDVLDALLTLQECAEVRAVVRELPHFEREVLCARFGLGPYDSHSLRQLADRFGVSLRTAWLAERGACELFRARWEQHDQPGTVIPIREADPDDASLEEAA